MRGLAMKAFGLLMAGVLLASFSLGTGAQDKKEATQAAPSTATPAASPKDVQSLDAMVAAIYDVISGPPGARDWNRFQSLFVKDARLIAVPFAQAYHAQLVQAAKLLHEAASLSQNRSLTDFLSKRADAFLSDDYYASDLAWMLAGTRATSRISRSATAAVPRAGATGDRGGGRRARSARRGTGRAACRPGPRTPRPRPRGSERTGRRGSPRCA